MRHSFFAILLSTILVACNGSHHPETLTYSVGGTVTGLTDILLLQNNSGDTLAVTTSGAFVFDDELPDGASYAVSILIQPDNQFCTLDLASGIIQSRNIYNVAIVCTDNNLSLGGTISIASNTQVDGDVNDPLANYIANDDVNNAQTLGNPVTLGGFASAEGTGIPGDRFASAADVADFYGVTLAAGQTITLSISDYDADNITAVDLNLLLYNASGDADTPIATAEGNAATESITVADSGSYILKVFAESGISNYTLNIGAQATQQSVLDLNLSTDFVVDEMIVRYRDNPSIATSTISSSIQAAGLQRKAGSDNRAMLWSMNTPVQRKQLLAQLGVKPHVLASIQHPSQPDVQKKRETIHAIKALRKRADILSVDLNYIRKPAFTPNDTHYHLQWHYPQINLPQAWDVTTGSSDVVVAVIDTGVFMTHPDLADNLTGSGYDFISSTLISNDGNGIDNNPDDPGDSTTLGQSSWHGTHVAGTIAAESNNASGVSGVCHSCRIMPLRALGVGGGTSYDIMQAVRYAAQLSNDSGSTPAQKADIINLSLGGSGSSQTEQDVYTAARNAGVIIIAAAGNDNSSQLFYPASYDGVVSVSAVDSHNNKAYYSNFGTTVDVAAPGGDLTVDDNNDGYGDGILSTLLSDTTGTRQANFSFYQGTSMAAPHVAGVAALMVAVRKADSKTLTPDEFDSLLANNSITTDLGDAGRDNIFGYGLIDAFAAVQAVSEDAPTTLVVNPVALNFGVVSGVTNRTLTVSKSGSNPLNIVSITSNAAWLTITEDTVDGDGLGTYTATATRGALDDGVYAATLTFVSSTTTVNVNVSAQIGASIAIETDAGYVYALLLDANTLDVLDVLQLSASNGEYDYNFTALAAGDYRVVAGSDMDNDYIICDPGEACGMYPILSNDPGIISLQQNATDIDFSMLFTSGINSTMFDNPNAIIFRRSLHDVRHVAE